MAVKNDSPVTLDTLLQDIFRLTPLQKTGLAKLRIETAGELLHYFPLRYSSIADIKNIIDLQKGDEVTIYGRIISSKTSKGFKTKIPMTEAVIEDATGQIKAVWFHQAYISKMLIPGAMTKLSGHIEERKEILYMANPELSRTKEMPLETPGSIFETEEHAPLFYPVYSETKGITSRFIYHHIQKLFSKGILEHVVDPIPEETLARYHLPTLTTALVWIHAPQKEDDAQSARKRFAFEEVFTIQLARKQERAFTEKQGGYKIVPDKYLLDEFIKRFPFKPTESQTKTLNEILSDMKRGTPMGRLLEGDVGSGKTFVAATAAYAVISSPPPDNKFGNLQVTYMAPTEILAEQHFKSFIEYFKDMPIEIGLLTGTGAKKFPSKLNADGSTKISRAQLLKWVEEGKLSILIGTHALIQKSVQFKNLGLAIVDEQHRFGTAQRGKLTKKEITTSLLPHFLSMTATPIPRTLALTIYGNLDLSLLNEMPHGRLPIKTELVSKSNRKKMEEEIRAEISRGRQAYIICPRIDEPDPEKELALQARSVIAEAKRIAENVFPEFEVGVLHGKMKPDEKTWVMDEFKKGTIHILVATSVIEVGVNVPNATIIAIEGAERFGLAQLHQLRGRVIRSNDQAYCYILTDSTNETSQKRLKTLVTAKNGFELAELDLTLRGSGELSGGKQWGISDLGMEAIKNIKMVEAAQTEASEIIQRDPELKDFPLLLQQINKKHRGTHWE